MCNICCASQAGCAKSWESLLATFKRHTPKCCREWPLRWLWRLVKGLNLAHDLPSRSKTMDDNAASSFRILTPMKSRCGLRWFANWWFKLHFRAIVFFPGSYRSRDVTSICGKVAAWFRWSHGDRLALETKSTWHDQRVIKNWHNGTCWNVETCLASPSNHSLPSKEPVLAVLPHSTSSHWRWCWAGRKC